MTNKFTYIYLKFILAITFCILSYNSYTKHYTISIKVILLIIVALAWAILGVYNFKKWKSTNGVNY
jgi:membrane protein YdbS with pleckstrin-like domain